MPRVSTSCAARPVRRYPKPSVSPWISPISRKFGGAAVLFRPGFSILARWRSPRIPPLQTSAARSRIRAKAAGPSMRRSKRRCLPTSSPRRCSRGFVRARSTRLVTSFCRRCVSNSAAMSNIPPQILLPNEPAPRPTAKTRHVRGGRTGTLMTPPPVVDVAGDGEALARLVAGFIAARASASERFGLCLSGGATPKRAYELLADLGASLDWQKIHLFWGDERFVPPDHRDSNFRMAREALIDHVPIAAAQVHPIPTSSASPDEAAALYEATLQGFYRSNTLDPERPFFAVH